MAKRSKDGKSSHDLRNNFLRERALKLERRNAWHETKEFAQLCENVARRRNMRWFKNPKDTVSKSLGPWFAGEQNLYFWALDVVEIALIEIEGNMRVRETVSASLSPAPEPTPTPSVEEPADARTISGGTIAELDALREIVTAFVPLDDEARSRVLSYLSSL